jgi:hypothetical protein
VGWGGGGGGKDRLGVGPTTVTSSRADCLQILGPSASRIPKGLYRAVVGLLYLYLFLKHLSKLRPLPNMNM